MPEFHFYLPANLLLAFAAYFVGCASPGPSILAIMTTAMSRGRPRALALAAGVMCGSLVWGVSAAFGLSALMQAYSWSLVVLKALGGCYMLWLSWKAAREAWSPTLDLAARGPQEQPGGDLRTEYLKGLSMHLTNPKAIFVWVSIVALALPAQHAQPADALAVVAGCAVLGLMIFFGYALAFSTALARTIYRRTQRAFNGTLALVFAWAGVQMLLSGHERR